MQGTWCDKNEFTSRDRLLINVDGRGGRNKKGSFTVNYTSQVFSLPVADLD